MPVVVIPTGEIIDWESFHDVFSRTLGFPAYYGRNMDAWIDCVTYADDSSAGMVAPDVVVAEGDILTLKLLDAGGFAARCPDQFAALVKCSDAVNGRRFEQGQRPVVALAR